MPGANEELFDALNRHQVFLIRYGGASAKRAVTLLKAAEKDVLARMALKAGNMSSVQSTRYQQMIFTLRKQSKDLLNALEKQSKADLLELAGQEVDISDARLNQAFGVDLNNFRVPPEVLRTLVESQGLRARRLKDWWGDIGKSRLSRLESAVGIGVMTGETSPQIARRFRDAEKVTARQATALVRTHVNHVANAARQSFYEANDDLVDQVRWTATLDGRTSHICQSRDGKSYPLKRGPRPPAHPNCRSTMVPVTKSWDDISNVPLKPGRGAKNLRGLYEKSLAAKGFSKADISNVIQDSRASLNGQVPGSLDYESWLRRQPHGFQNEVLGRTKATLFRKGGMPLDKFVDERAGIPLNLAQIHRANEQTWMQVFGPMDKNLNEALISPHLLAAQAASLSLRGRRARGPGEFEKLEAEAGGPKTNVSKAIKKAKLTVDGFDVKSSSEKAGIVTAMVADLAIEKKIWGSLKALDVKLAKGIDGTPEQMAMLDLLEDVNPDAHEKFMDKVSSLKLEFGGAAELAELSAKPWAGTILKTLDPDLPDPSKVAVLKKAMADEDVAQDALNKARADLKDALNKDGLDGAFGKHLPDGFDDLLPSQALPVFKVLADSLPDTLKAIKASKVIDDFKGESGLHAKVMDKVDKNLSAATPNAKLAVAKAWLEEEKVQHSGVIAAQNQVFEDLGLDGLDMLKKKLPDDFNTLLPSAQATLQEKAVLALYEDHLDLLGSGMVSPLKTSSVQAPEMWQIHMVKKIDQDPGNADHSPYLKFHLVKEALEAEADAAVKLAAAKDTFVDVIPDFDNQANLLLPSNYPNLPPTQKIPLLTKAYTDIFDLQKKGPDLTSPEQVSAAGHLDTIEGSGAITWKVNLVKEVKAKFDTPVEQLNMAKVILEANEAALVKINDIHGTLNDSLPHGWLNKGAAFLPDGYDDLIPTLKLSHMEDMANKLLIEAIETAKASPIDTVAAAKLAQSKKIKVGFIKKKLKEGQPLSKTQQALWDNDLTQDEKDGILALTQQAKAAETPTIMFHEDFPKIGPKPGGSMDGFLAKHTPTGEEWIVKIPAGADAESMAFNEALSAQLYRAAGVNHADVHYVKGPQGEHWAVSKMLPNAKKVTRDTMAQSPEVLENMAVDAWLGNWDVVGLEFDNIISSGGRLYRIDAGGSMKFRAMGGQKEIDDWLQRPDIQEMDTFREPSINAQSASVFGKASQAQIEVGVRKVLAVTDAQIDDILDKFGPDNRGLGVMVKAEYRAALISRRDWLAKKFPHLKAPEPPAPINVAVSAGSFAERVTGSRSIGASRMGDKDMVEDHNILFWEEGDAIGKMDTTGAKLTLRTTVLDKQVRPPGSGSGRNMPPIISAGFQKFNMQAKQAVIGMKHYSAIRQEELDRVRALRDVFNDMEDGKIIVHNKDFLEPARKWLEAMEKAIKPGLGQAADLPDLNALGMFAAMEDFPIVVAAKATKTTKASYTWTKLDALPAKYHDKGYLIRRPAGFNDRDRGVEDGHIRLGSSEMPYEADVDGVTVHYWPRTGPGKAVQGNLHVMTKKTGQAALKEIDATLKKLGIDTKPPKLVDMERRYLFAHYRARNERPPKPGNGGTAAYVQAMKDDLSQKAGYDITKSDYWQPAGKENAFQQGHKVFLRADVDNMSSDWDTANFGHGSSGTANDELLKNVIHQGGWMTPKAEFDRKGMHYLRWGGLSPGPDRLGGGSHYIYTSLNTSGGDQAFRFDGKTMARRVDARMHHTDPTGDIDFRDGPMNLHTPLDPARPGAWQGYETIFKNGLSVYDTGFTFYTRNVSAMIRWLKDQGEPFSKGLWPDGRKLEEVILSD